MSVGCTGRGVSGRHRCGVRHRLCYRRLLGLRHLRRHRARHAGSDAKELFFRAEIEAVAGHRRGRVRLRSQFHCRQSSQDASGLKTAPGRRPNSAKSFHRWTSAGLVRWGLLGRRAAVLATLDYATKRSDTSRILFATVARAARQRLSAQLPLPCLARSPAGAFLSLGASP